MKNNRVTYFMNSENEITINDYLLSLCLLLEETEIEENNAVSDIEVAA